MSSVSTIKSVLIGKSTLDFVFGKPIILGKIIREEFADLMYLFKIG